jgi:uncharacterized membrane protein YqiK
VNPVVLVPVLVTIGAVFVFITGAALMVKKFYLKVSPGQALINNKTGDQIAVSLTGGLVLPIIHRAETMDISVKMIEIERRGKEGLICKDNIRADIKVAFFVRVNPEPADIRKVAERIGCARASHWETLNELFAAKFSEALKTVGYQMMFVELYTERQTFKTKIIEVIGTDLDGYHLNDVAIDFLEQTPLDSLDPENTMDSEGIRAITQITKQREVDTNRLRNEAQMQIEKQNTEAQDVITKLEAQRKVIIAAREREAAVGAAREQAEAQKVVAEERLKIETARIRTEEDVAIQEQNKARQIEVAQKNRERVVGIETERVAKDRHLEAISREREVELSRIEKEKLLEVQRKEIADVVRTRVAVDRTVAEEEERIKGVRVLEEAKRQKDSALILAESEALSQLTKDIKAAEAQAQAATHHAKQRLTLADAELEVADRDARAKVRRSEGILAESAAAGLAEVKVKEADASALEKRGLIEAKLQREKGLAGAQVLEAEAQAQFKKLEAQAKGEEARAGAVEKMGLAEAVAIRERGHAEADVTQTRMHAEAEGTQKKMLAEAEGIQKKMTAMKAMEGSAREHEEFRLRLENERAIKLQGLEIQSKIAVEQAKLLSEAFKNAKIDIVGGDGAFFDRFVNAVSLGKSIDAIVEKSNLVQSVAGDYVSGDRSLAADIKDVLGSGQPVRDVSLSHFLHSLAGGAQGMEKKKIEALLEKAKELGLK